jgi:tetrahydromethanopterin S-methyltransferase subunit G
MCGREEQNNKVDPHRRRDLSNALDELERLLPLQVKAAKEAKEKPRDAAAKKAVLEINGLVGNAVDDVVRKAVPAPKDRAASALANGLDELDRLLEAVKREDPARAALSIRGIGACLFFIIIIIILLVFYLLLFFAILLTLACSCDRREAGRRGSQPGACHR